MDLEHLNLLKLELHEAKTQTQKAGAELECRKMYIESLELAILQLESVREVEEQLKECQEARKMDAEVLKSWQSADKTKGLQIDDLRQKNQALTTELANLVRKGGNDGS